MFTGAIASSYYGRPRTTLDVDLIIAVERRDLARLANTLSKAGLEVHESELESAWRSDYRIATLQDKKSPHTVDIIFASRKMHRIRGHIEGLPTYYETAESLILAKLKMLKVTIQPERATTDREDIKKILEFVKIDLKSLRKNAEAEGTISILNDLMSRS